MITLARVTAISFISLYLLVMFYLFYPYQPVEMELVNGRLPVMESKVVAGDNVTVLMNFKKNSNCAPSVRWYLVDGFVLQLSTDGVRRSVGDNSIERKVSIPEFAPKEKVHLRIEYACKVNPLKTINYSWDTESFTVI